MINNKVNTLNTFYFQILHELSGLPKCILWHTLHHSEVMGFLPDVLPKHVFLRDFIPLNFIPDSSQVLFGSMFSAVMGNQGVPALENLLAKVARE